MADPHPSLSVVIPVWNGARYIAATLASIARQGIDDVEVIVVDGDSSDGTQAIVSASGLPNLTLVSRPDRGQLEALQTGVAMAQGAVVMWLNADDIVMPGAFRAVLDAFAAQPQADFVYSDDCAFDEAARGFYYGSGIRGLEDWDHLLFYRQLYSECVYWRREVTRLLPQDAYDLRVYTDYAFFLNLRWGRRGLWLPQRLGAFRIRNDQNSQAFTERKHREYRRVKAEHRARIGLSAWRYRVYRVLYAPWYWPRHVLRPGLARAWRKLGRIVSGDRARKAETDTFYGDWLIPSK